MAENEDLMPNDASSSIRCRYCGQRNQVRADGGDARCGRCRLPLSDAPHKKFSKLDKNEYMAVVEARFKAANPDNDGTLDAKELRSRAGLALLRLVK